MSTTKQIATRTLIWLAAILIPLQGIPAPACGCFASNECSQSSTQIRSCCCSEEAVSQGQCCCSRREAGATHPCCSGVSSGQDSTSQVACNCQCGKTNQDIPATPPVENNQLEKVLTDAPVVSSLGTTYQPKATSQQGVVSSVATPLAALDRCISLCRFSL